MKYKKLLLNCLIVNLLIVGGFVFAQTFITLQSVTPTSGQIGDQVVIKGVNLGVDSVTNCAPYNKGGQRDSRCNVQFHDINLRRSTVSGTETAPDTVVANVPTDLCPGSYTIKVGEVTDFSNKIPFTVEPPPADTALGQCRFIESVTPDTGLQGATVTIKGRNLHDNVQLYNDSYGKNDVQGSINGTATEVIFNIPSSQEPGTYMIRVGPNVTDVSNGLPFTVLGDTKPPLIYNIRVDNITTSSAEILWDTTELADGQIELCPSRTSCGTHSPLNATLSTSHSVSLSKLGQRTYYYFWIKSKDANGNLAVVGPLFFRTRSVVLPYIYSVVVTDRTMNSADIEWKTNIESDSQIEYCLTTVRCGNNTPVDSTLTKNHSVVLAGLEPGTRYYYWVKSTDANGYDVISSLHGLRTSYPPRPYVYNIRVVNKTTTSATIEWKTDIESDSQIEYCLTTARCGNNTPVDSTLTKDHSVILAGLESGEVYFIWPKSTSAEGYSSNLSWYAFRSARIYPPSLINLRISDVTQDSVVIRWDTTVPADSQVKYCLVGIECDVNSPLDTVLTKSHSVALTGLETGTYYYFWIKSRDANGVLGTAGSYLFKTRR